MKKKAKRVKERERVPPVVYQLVGSADDASWKTLGFFVDLDLAEATAREHRETLAWQVNDADYSSERAVLEIWEQPLGLHENDLSFPGWGPAGESIWRMELEMRPSADAWGEVEWHEVEEDGELGVMPDES